MLGKDVPFVLASLNYNTAIVAKMLENEAILAAEDVYDQPNKATGLE